MAAADSARHQRAYTALQHRDFRIIWLAELVSTVGTQMQRVAVAWLIFQLTDNAFNLGLLGLARFGPILLFGLFGGVLADRRDRRKLLLITQSLLAVTSLSLAYVSNGKDPSLWAIYGLVFCSAAVGSFAGPSRQALVPSLVPRSDLAGAMTMQMLAMQVATVIGPAVGGLLIAQFSVPVVLVIDAFSFLAVISGVLLMKARPVVAVATGSTIAAAIEGLRFLKQTPTLLGVMSLDFVATFFGSATVLMPLFAEQILGGGAREAGILLAAPAAGSVVMGFAMSIRPAPERPGVGVLASVAAYGIAIAAFGASGALIPAAAMLTLSGAADAISMTYRSTIRNLITPDHLRGRVAATHSMFAMGGPQLGEFEAGVAASTIGVGPSIVFGGIATVATAGIIAATVPSILKYRYGAESAPAPS